MLLRCQIGQICPSTYWIQFREDYYHHPIIYDFSAVCMPWFDVVKYNQSQHRSRPQPPMLLFFNNKQAAWSLYNVIENKVIEEFQFQLPKKRFSGSAYGWLVLVEPDFTVTLIKPFLNSKDVKAGRENMVIRLPQLYPPELSEGRTRWEWVEDCDYYVVKAIITADPILNADECIVILIYMEELRMAFVRPGKDTRWTYLPTEHYGIADIIQREDGKFYAICTRGNLLTFNITSESVSVVKSFECAIGCDAYFIRRYLVEGKGKDLLMVVRDCDWEDLIHLRSTLGFKVYKFDFDKCLWIEKETLGDDVAILIGENLSISVAASDFPGCKQNCIYFNHDYYSIYSTVTLNDFGMSEMEKKCFSKPYSEHVMTLLKMVNHRPIWFTPTLQL